MPPAVRHAERIVVRRNGARPLVDHIIYLALDSLLGTVVSSLDQVVELSSVVRPQATDTPTVTVTVKPLEKQ